jgi:hypothetical protein
MTSMLKERFCGAANAAQLMDHRTQQAMALLQEHHEGEITHDIKRITATYSEHSRMVFNGQDFSGLDALEKAHTLSWKSSSTIKVKTPLWSSLGSKLDRSVNLLVFPQRESKLKFLLSVSTASMLMAS